MSRLSEAKLVPTIKTWHPIYADAPDELIADMNDKSCKSNFGNWAKVTHTAVEFCKKDNLSTITSDIAKKAIAAQHGWLT